MWSHPIFSLSFVVAICMEIPYILYFSLFIVVCSFSVFIAVLPLSLVHLLAVFIVFGSISLAVSINPLAFVLNAVVVVGSPPTVIYVIREIALVDF
jgi:hypothetical protein